MITMIPLSWISSLQSFKIMGISGSDMLFGFFFVIFVVYELFMLSINFFLKYTFS